MKIENRKNHEAKKIANVTCHFLTFIVSIYVPLATPNAANVLDLGVMGNVILIFVKIILIKKCQIFLLV